MSRAEIAKRSRVKHRDSYNAYMRKWRQKNPDKQRENARKSYEKSKRNPEQVKAKRRYHLKKTYGLALEEYEAMFVEQEGVCAVCKFPETAIKRGSTKSLDVDHNHETGKVRGLLCSACNSSLGLLREDPERIIALLEYVEKHNADT